MNPINLYDLEQELADKVFRPVYLLLGPELYLRRQALTSIKKSSVCDDALEFNYTEFSARTDSAIDVVRAASTFPMMSTHRIVLLHDLAALSDENRKELCAYVEEPQTTSLLVLVADELDRRTSFFRALKANSCIVDLANLRGAALERWAEQYVLDRGYRISFEAIRQIIDLAGTDLQSVCNEIDKLLLYGSDRKVIPDSIIGDLVQGNRHHRIFELMAALGRRERSKAIKLLGNLLETGEHPLMIVTMLARHFRQILVAKDLQEQGRNSREISKAAQIPPFKLNEFLYQARAMSEEVAQKMYLDLADAEYRFKSSGIDERILLERLICTLW